MTIPIKEIFSTCEGRTPAGSAHIVANILYVLNFLEESKIRLSYDITD
jgi:hypothetical protein